MERKDAGPVCANGNPIDLYPKLYRDGQRMGVNFKGHVEYWNQYEVIALLYEVHADVIDEMHVHSTYGETPKEHVENTVKQHGYWWYIEDWVTE